MALVKVKPISGKSNTKLDIDNSINPPFAFRADIDVRQNKFSVDLTEGEIAILSKELGRNLSTVFDPDDTENFWGNNYLSLVKLQNKTNIFDTDNIKDRILLSIIRASKYVANSKEDYEEGLFPYAKFYIDDTILTEANKEKQFVLRKNIIKKIDSLTRMKKEELLRILVGGDYNNQSNDYLDMKIMECLDTVGLDAIQNVLNKDDRDIFLHALILEAISKGVLRREGKVIFYFSDKIGYNVEDAIEFLKNGNNQPIFNSIVSQTRPTDSDIKKHIEKKVEEKVSEVLGKKEEDKKGVLKNKGR